MAKFSSSTPPHVTSTTFLATLPWSLMSPFQMVTVELDE